MTRNAIKIAHISILDIHIFLILNHLKKLRDDGYEVHLICNEGRLLPMFESKGFQIHTIEAARKVSPLADLKALSQLFLLLRRERFTIVHTHTPKIELIGQLAAKLAGVPITIHTNHGLYFRRDMSQYSRRFLILVAKVASLFSDHVLSQSREDITTALEENLYRSDQISYLGNGIDLAYFDIRRFSCEAIRRKKAEIGIPSHGRIVGMIGRFVIEKGYREFFKAAQVIAKRYVDTFFLTVGTVVLDEVDPVDWGLLRELGLEDRVVRLESRLDMPELYAVMDLVVLPTYREGFPRSLIEAAAMSRPVVATNIPGCREAVKEGVTGFLIPPKQVNPLVEKIEYLLTHREVSIEMGKHGRELAEQAFDEREVIARLQACYTQQLSRKLAHSPICD